MAWTKYTVFLAALLVFTGSINTLSTKWADELSSVGSDGTKRKFNHPFLQASAMFFGEMLCLFTFKLLAWGSARTPSTSIWNLLRGNQNFDPFILLPAAMLDLVGTSVMYVGLNLTYPSSFQMFRGSIIVFTALLSVVILNKNILLREWSGIISIIIGLLVVGASDFIFKDAHGKGPNSIITGDLLIVLAQIISACQMVYEEKYISGLDIAPLQAVGWEGVFGFVALIFLQIIFYFIPAPAPFDQNPRHTVEDSIDGLIQIGNNGFLLMSVLGTIISIAFFNFAGISMTKETSATTRMVLDSARTIIIWVVSLAIMWQDFHWPQLVGFIVLIIGMCIYNNIGVQPIVRKILGSRSAPADSIINHDALRENEDDLESVE